MKISYWRIVMKIWKLVFAAGLVLACTMGMGENFSAQSKEVINITFANAFPETHAVNVAFTEFIKELESRSNGEMTGTIFPNNQLGSDASAISAMQDHSLAMSWLGTPPLATIVREMGVFDIPFFFDSVEQANKALANKKLNSLLDSKFNEKGFKLFGVNAYGYRWLSANRSVTRLEDLKGLKLRVAESPYYVAFWKALGVSPTPLPNSERYTALQQGTVDGQENLIENAYNSRMYEVQEYFVNTKHLVFCAGWVMDKQFWDDLKPEQQALVTELLEKCRQKAVELAVARETELLNDLENKFHRKLLHELPDGEFERWGNIARPVVVDMVREKIGDDIINALFEAIKEN